MIYQIHHHFIIAPNSFAPYFPLAALMSFSPLRRTSVQLPWSRHIWACPSKQTCRSPQWRRISTSRKVKQNVAPSMQQLRAPFSQKNVSTACATLSLSKQKIPFTHLTCILQMLHPQRHHRHRRPLLRLCAHVQDGSSMPTTTHPPPFQKISNPHPPQILTGSPDLHPNRLGRPTHQSLQPHDHRHRPLPPRHPRDLLAALTHHLQRFRLGRTPLEIHPAAARSARIAR